MKIFLTGGSGYIGSVTTELLCNDGHDVTVFDNLERGHIEAVDPRARLIVGDLRDASAVFNAMRAVKPDAVVHFAAYALVGESMQLPSLYFDNNTGGGIHLLDAMLKYDVPKIIFSSTCATYGQPEKMPMDESIPQRPTNPYGESKLMFETALRWEQQRHGLKPVFLRYFNACGATPSHGEDHDPETHIIPNILRVPLGQADAVPVFGDDYPTPDGTCLRDFIDIVDLAKAHVCAVRRMIDGKMDEPYEIFNIGTGRPLSVMELITAFEKVNGIKLNYRFAPRREGDVIAVWADPSLAEKKLGWKATRTVEETLASAWAWEKKLAAK